MLMSLDDCKVKVPEMLIPFTASRKKTCPYSQGANKRQRHWSDKHGRDINSSSSYALHLVFGTR